MTTAPHANRPFPWVDIVCPCHEGELISSDEKLSQKIASQESTIEPTLPEVKSEMGSSAQPPGSDSSMKSRKSLIPKAIWDPFSRHKLEYLYFCEFCQDIKCSRCIEEEVVCRYCPVCLFEVTPATARSEGNRCPRNCFKCPDCFTSVNPRPVTGAAVAAAAASFGRASSRAGARQLKNDQASVTAQLPNSYKLACTNCSWTSDSSKLAVDDDSVDPTIENNPLVFQRGRSLMQQLQNVNGRNLNSLTKRFQDLRMFYFQRSLEEGTRAALVDDRIFGTTSSHISGDDNTDLKSVITSRANKVRSFAEILEQRIQERNKQDTSAETFTQIREVDEATDQRQAVERSTTVTNNFIEYRELLDTATDNGEKKLDKEGYRLDSDCDIEIPCTLDMTSFKVKPMSIIRDRSDIDQRLPVPQPLRSKRTKRCATCHHILARPEAKPSSVRFKIKLMAHNYLPTLRLSEFPPKSGYPKEFIPGNVYTLLLTITNPIHVNVKVSLATISRQSMSGNEERLFGDSSGATESSLASGRYSHQVTIITPTVDLGPDEELWDEASLIRGVPSMFIKRESSLSKRIDVEGSRISAKTAHLTSGGTASSGGPGSLGAGVYQQSKNWSCIAIEVLPSGDSSFLEIPLFVNFSFEVPADEEEDENKKSANTKGKAEAVDSENQSEDKDRESKHPEIMTFGYWTVLGAGPIKQT